MATRLFRWLAGPAFIEDLSGDLDELFYQDLHLYSVRRAQWNHWRRVWSLGLSYALRARRRQRSFHPLGSSTFQPAILASHLRVAVRSLKRDKFFTVMNVVGLAIGMSISLLLLALIGYVSGYDTFHENRDSIYRIITRTDGPEGTDDWASSPPAIYDQLNASVSAVKAYVRLQAGEVRLERQSMDIPLTGFYVSPEFLQVFTFPLVKGSAATALNRPNTLLLTESAAIKVFGKEDAFGKVITINGLVYEITGILKDHPRNSHLHFEVLLPYSMTSNQLLKLPQRWSEFNDSYQYLLIPSQETQMVQSRLNAIAEQVNATNPVNKMTFSLQPLNGIVPGPDLRNGAGPSWDLLGMSIFFFLTLLILLPACANYAMISISRALRRMKEIGIRKTIGSTRHQITLQFVLEAIIIAWTALVLSLYFFVLVRDEFLGMIVYGRESLDLSVTPVTAVLFAGFTLLVGLFSGLIPGMYFANLNPLAAIQNKTGKRTTKRFSLRKAMLVVQFALSLGFVMSVVIVFSQYRKTLQSDFGFDRENILDVDLQGLNPALVQTELSRVGAVESISLSSHAVGTQFPASVFVHKNPGDSMEAFTMSVDSHYLHNLGLRLVAGRNFDPEPERSRGQIIVNEQFVRQSGLAHPVDILGQTFTVGDQHLTVSGVIADFHYTTLRYPVQPFYFACDQRLFTRANVKLSTTDPVEAITALERGWKSFGGEKKFMARFLDDELEEAYSFYFTMIKICGILGLLAVSISSLGLLGMVVFTVQTRVKEIGIRKVMGSSTQSIVFLLSWDFARLMLTGFTIAAPLTYVFMDRVYLRLENSKIPISMMDILISLMLLLALGLTAILSQTIRAAQANPVDTLRQE